jgi:UDP-N-acetylmuramyl pentapeptide phosphotransferase/UDP-N-acetylglucosamine-1-phosphate transferase
MGGGLFGTPLYLNVKCIVFSFLVLIVYWLPHPPTLAHNIVMAFLLGTASYISLAWYDVIYDCNDRLKPTFLGWLSKPFKPKEYSEKYEKLPLKYKKIIRWVDISVLSILAFALFYPFLFSKGKSK